MTQVNASVGEAQYIADTDFTTKDSRVWDRLPGVKSPVLLMDGALVRCWAGARP